MNDRERMSNMISEIKDYFQLYGLPVCLGDTDFENGKMKFVIEEKDITKADETTKGEIQAENFRDHIMVNMNYLAQLYGFRYKMPHWVSGYNTYEIEVAINFWKIG